MERPDTVDKLLDIIINLSREVWVLSDRQRIIEQCLADRGIDLTDAIERYQPDDAMRESLEAEREAFLSRVLAPALEETS